MSNCMVREVSRILDGKILMMRTWMQFQIWEPSWNLGSWKIEERRKPLLWGSTISCLPIRRFVSLWIRIPVMWSFERIQSQRSCMENGEFVRVESGGRWVVLHDFLFAKPPTAHFCQHWCLHNNCLCDTPSSDRWNIWLSRLGLGNSVVRVSCAWPAFLICFFSTLVRR